MRAALRRSGKRGPMRRGNWLLGVMAAGAFFAAGERGAAACGGCFTAPPPPPPSPRPPSVVTDHRMIVSISQGQTTLYDELRYSGDPESFAWVLPISGTAKLGVSSDGLFSTLEAMTQVTVIPPPLNCPLPPSSCAQRPRRPHSDAGRDRNGGRRRRDRHRTADRRALRDRATRRDRPDRAEPVAHVARVRGPGRHQAGDRSVRRRALRLPRAEARARRRHPGDAARPRHDDGRVGGSAVAHGRGRNRRQRRRHALDDRGGTLRAAELSRSSRSRKRSSSGTGRRTRATSRRCAPSAPRRSSGRGWELESSVSFPADQMRNCRHERLLPAVPGWLLRRAIRRRGAAAPRTHAPARRTTTRPRTAGAGRVARSSKCRRTTSRRCSRGSPPTSGSRARTLRSRTRRSNRDLVLAASADQGLLAPARKVTREKNQPTCTIYKGCNAIGQAPRDEAVARSDFGSSNESFSCAMTTREGRGNALLTFAGFAALALVAAKRLRRK